MFEPEDNILEQMEQRVLELRGEETEQGMGPVILGAVEVERDQLLLPSALPPILIEQAQQIHDDLRSDVFADNLLQANVNDSVNRTLQHLNGTLDSLSLTDEQAQYETETSMFPSEIIDATFEDTYPSVDNLVIEPTSLSGGTELAVIDEDNTPSLDTSAGTEGLEVHVNQPSNTDLNVHVANDNEDVLNEMSGTLASMHKQSTDELARQEKERNRTTISLANDNANGLGDLTAEQLAALGLAGGSTGEESSGSMGDLLAAALGGSMLGGGSGTPPVRPGGTPHAPNPNRGFFGNKMDAFKNFFKGSKVDIAKKGGKAAALAGLAYYMFGDTISYAINGGDEDSVANRKALEAKEPEFSGIDTFATSQMQSSHIPDSNYKPVPDAPQPKEDPMLSTTSQLGLAGLGGMAAINIGRNYLNRPAGVDANLRASLESASELRGNNISDRPRPPTSTGVRAIQPTPSSLGTQVARAVEQATPSTSGSSKALSVFKKIPGIDVGFAAYDVYGIMNNEELSDRERNIQLTGVLGGMGGGKLGGIAGASMGSFVGPIGTLVGGFLGSIGGYVLGDEIMESVVGSFLDEEEEKVETSPMQSSAKAKELQDQVSSGAPVESLPYHPVLNPKGKDEKAHKFSYGFQPPSTPVYQYGSKGPVRKEFPNEVPIEKTLIAKDRIAEEKNNIAKANHKIRQASSTVTGIPAKDARVTTESASVETKPGRVMARQVQSTRTNLGSELSKIPIYYTRDPHGYKSFEKDYSTGLNYSSYVALYDQALDPNTTARTNDEAPLTMDDFDVASNASSSTVGSYGEKTAASISASVDKKATGDTSFDKPEDFIASMYPQVQSTAKELGVDPKILIAQAALETGWGKHINKNADGTSSNNLYNIKASKGWKGKTASVNTKEYDKEGNAYRMDDDFRSYDGYEDSFSDYSNFLQTNPRYENALANAGNGKNYLQELQKAGYATDPEYADKIMSIVNGKTFKKFEEVQTNMSSNTDITKALEKTKEVDVASVVTPETLSKKLDNLETQQTQLVNNVVEENKILGTKDVETKANTESKQSPYYAENRASALYDTTTSAKVPQKDAPTPTKVNRAKLVQKHSPAVAPQRPRLQDVPVIIDDSGLSILQLGYV